MSKFSHVSPRRGAAQKRLVLSLIAAALLVAAVFAAASFLPIYPDEIAYKIFLERFWLNGGLKQSVTPFCAPGFLYAPPLLLRPAAMVWTLPVFLGHGWASYRLLPLLALAWIVSALLFEGWRRRSAPAILTVAMIGAGAAPFGLVIFRPEVFVLAVALGIFAIFRRLASETPFGRRALLSLFAVFLYSLICYMHPKAIYLAPLMIAGLGLAGFRASGRAAGMALAGLGIVLTVVMTMQAIKMHRTQYLSCPDYPKLEATMKRQSVNLLQALRSRAGIEAAVKKLSAPDLTAHGIAQLGYNPAPDIGYLPKPPASALTALASGAAKLALLSAFLLGLWKLVQAPFVLGRGGASEQALAVLLWLGLVSPYVLSLTRHWYDAAAFCGGLTITSVLFLAARAPALVRAVVAALSVTAAATSLAVMARFEVPAFLHGYAGPSISLAVNREAVDHVVHELLQKYRVPENAPLMVDDLTYEGAKNRPIVLPVTYLAIGLSRPARVMSALKKLGASYGVARKSYAMALAKLPGFRILATAVVPGSGQRIALFVLDAPSGGTP